MAVPNGENCKHRKRTKRGWNSLPPQTSGKRSCLGEQQFTGRRVTAMTCNIHERPDVSPDLSHFAGAGDNERAESEDCLAAKGDRADEIRVPWKGLEQPLPGVGLPGKIR